MSLQILPILSLVLVILAVSRLKGPLADDKPTSTYSYHLTGPTHSDNASNEERKSGNRFLTESSDDFGGTGLDGIGDKQDASNEEDSLIPEDDEDSETGDVAMFSNLEGMLPSLDDQHTTPESRTENRTGLNSSQNKKNCSQVDKSELIKAAFKPTDHNATGGYTDSDCGLIVEPVEPGYKELLNGLTVKDCEYYSCGYDQPFCKCEPSCVLYGDCCYGYLEKILGKQIITDKLRNKTTLFRMLVSDELFVSEIFIQEHSKCIWNKDKWYAIWMISRCPSSYVGATTVNKCEDGDQFGLDSLPVDRTDTRGRVLIYRNIYCALCHGVDIDALTNWEISVNCEKSDEAYVIPTGNFSLTELDPACSIQFRSTTPGSRQYVRDCLNTESYKRACQNVAMPQSYLDLCESYVYTVSSAESTFRNPHCAVCKTGHSNYSTICQEKHTSEYEEGAVDLRLLFDFNPDKGLTIQASCIAGKKCLYFEMYDCISAQCRRLFCSDNQMPYFGNCIARNTSISSDIWFEQSLPTDIKNNKRNILYVEIEIITPYSLSNHGVFRNIIEQFGSVQNVGMTVINNDFGLQLHRPDVNGQVIDEPSTEIEHSEMLKPDANLLDNTRKPDINKNALKINNATHVDETSNEQNTSESDKNIDLNNVRTGFDGSAEVNHEAGSKVTSFISEHGQRTNYTELLSTVPTELMGARGDKDQHDTNVMEEGVIPEQFHYWYTFTVLIKENNTLSTTALGLTKAFKPIVLNRDAFDLIDSDIRIETRTYSDWNNLRCDVGNLTIELNASFFGDMKDEMKVFEIATDHNKVSMNDAHWTISVSSAEKAKLNMVAFCFSRFEVPGLNCNMTVYDTNEVSILYDKIRVKHTMLSYTASEYKVIGRKVFVCVEKVTAANIVRFFRYSKFQRDLSLVTSSVSIVCLIFICFGHIILSKLRNNHGLNMLALSATMLLVQVMMLIDYFPAEEACAIFATFLHFLVLKMFAWMNVIGFDMAITFYSKTLPQRNVNIRRFVKYFVFAVSLPLVIICTCLSLEYSGAYIRPGYGVEGVCWLTSSVSLLMFFIAPVLISIIFNLIVFSLTLHLIQRAKAKSSMRTNSTNRSYCFVYIKMSMILGFTWSVGIISAFVSVDWLWYIHITLNGLQGLSLFLCSMVNARTVNIIRESSQRFIHSDTTYSKTKKDSNVLGIQNKSTSL